MTTKLIRSFQKITPADLGGTITIGNFDGVHLGHQNLLAQVIAHARAQGMKSTVITFEPHPFEYFSRENVSVPRLTRFREKFLALSACHVDNVLILPFNQKLASLPASDFVTYILHQQLRVAHLIIGDDFRFGHQRLGDYALLEKMGEKLGFTVSSMPTFSVKGVRVSSTRVRAALGEGDHELAKFLLGRPYSMVGKVRRGDQLGRQWGFPTANIFLLRRLTPVHGIYTVWVYGLGPQPLPGVANVGSRPTVDGTRTLLEVHLLDFNQNIYGRRVKVEFCTKLRDEERYDSIDLLKQQIAKDVLAARNYFQKQGVLCYE